MHSARKSSRKAAQGKAAPAEIGEHNFESEVLKSKPPVLVEFWAPWSRPCQILRSALDQAVLSCAGRVKIVRVNADNHPDLSLLYEIQAIPTLLYFVAGNVRARIVGTASKEAILSKIRAATLDGASSTSPSGAFQRT